MQYKIYVYKNFHLIPEIFNINLDVTADELNEKIVKALNGNAICFNDTNKKARIYDRDIIHKIYIKENICAKQKLISIEKK